MMSTHKHISKITSMTIEDFAGFISKHTIDTNADLVLIAGPNGYGKSSLLKAILFLLTGYLYLPDHYDDIASVYISKGKKCLKIKAEVELSEDGRREIELGLAKDQPAESDQNSRLVGNWANEIKKILPGYPEEQDDPELRARVCGFFQEHAEALFDETTRGKTIRDFFEPLPAGLAEIEEYLKNETDGDGERLRGPALKKLADELTRIKNLWEESDKKYQKRLEDWPDEVLKKALQEKWLELTERYKKIRPDGSGWPEPPRGGDIEEIGQFIRELGAQTGKKVSKGKEIPSLNEILSDEIKRQMKAARRQGGKTSEAIASLSGDLEKLRDEIKNIEEEYPQLDRELTYFCSEEEDLPGLDGIFESLSKNADKWKEAGVGANELSRVMEQIRAVVPEEASKCAQLLRQWLEPRKEAKRRRDQLKRKEKELAEKLKAGQSRGQLRKLKKLDDEVKKVIKALNGLMEEQSLRKKWQETLPKRKPLENKLEETISSLEKVATAFASITSPSKELLEGFADVLNIVLGRFNLTDGILPVRLKGKRGSASAEEIRQLYAIKTKDGRRLPHLSTGQKVQMAVSVLVGQNLLLNQYLHHRVILLDDVTTAYDLSNLTREAILWRQLAYGGGDGSMRRQIFISSHHEDLTNQLLDLLIPPKGRSMRLIRFTGWDNEKGPELEQFAVEPTGSTTSSDYKMRKNNLIHNIEAGPWK